MPEAVAAAGPGGVRLRGRDVLPHSDDLMRLASEGVFSLRYPDHPLSARYRAIADRVAGVGVAG